MASIDPTLEPSTLRTEAARTGGLRADGVFRWAAMAAGVSVLVVIGAIGLFLLSRATPALREAGMHFFTERQWFPDATPPVFGMAALAFGTVLSSAVALVMAVPVAVGSALFITELAPPRLGRWLGHVVDLLAAVPSVVYGLWGFVFLVPALKPAERFLDQRLGFIPLFQNRTGAFGKSIFVGSVVLAIMILPIIAAIAREVFRQVPRPNREAALALGATRWEMIRMAVLPYSRSGVVGGVMLGLGRALGETIAVALVLGAAFEINIHITEPGGNTIAANIANKFGESGVLGRDALIASGLVLFAITLVVNVAARAIVGRTPKAAPAKS